jgi:hypothetical protein
MPRPAPLSMVKAEVEFRPRGDYLIYAFGSDLSPEHE